MQILKLMPAGKDYLWGGTRLRKEYRKKIDLIPLAETWECSVHPDGLSIVENGKYRGQTLKDVIDKHPEFLGTKNQEMPVLIKFIDAMKDLSVQVHPYDDYARKYEGEYHKKVLEKIREYNLDNDIIVTGYLKDSVGDYLKASDFAVLPFYYGISVRNGSFLAAYQEGIDIITTKGDKNFPYDDVYLMNDNTPQTIASAIEYMQDNSLKSEHRKIDFYWDDISKQHVELYEKIYG